jgi:hypothetical protein
LLPKVSAFTFLIPFSFFAFIITSAWLMTPWLPLFYLFFGWLLIWITTFSCYSLAFFSIILTFFIFWRFIGEILIHQGLALPVSRCLRTRFIVLVSPGCFFKAIEFIESATSSSAFQLFPLLFSFTRLVFSPKPIHP